jgi:hypothetical protein
MTGVRPLSYGRPHWAAAGKTPYTINRIDRAALAPRFGEGEPLSTSLSGTSMPM